MKKIVIILIFAVALIYYSAGNFVAPVLNDSSSNASGVVLKSTDQSPSSGEKLIDDKAAAGKLSHDQPEAHPGNAIIKPLEPAIHEALKELVDTSHDGLVEEKADMGVEMKLNGKFRTAPVATINEQGELTVRDYTSVPVQAPPVKSNLAQ